MGDSKRKNADSLDSAFSLTGRGRRIRTLNKGFGDPRVTITPCPYEHALLYRDTGKKSSRIFASSAIARRARKPSYWVELIIGINWREWPENA